MGEYIRAGASVRMSRRAALGGIGATVAMPGRVRAQQKWPTRPVRFIAQWSAGGSADTLARIYCQKVSELSGQPFIVDNRLGAGGLIGADAIAKADADGYTIGLGSIGTKAIHPHLSSKLAFNAGTDFTFISGMWQLPNLLVVPKSLGVSSVPELITLLRASPGKYFFGSSGLGTSTHIAGEMFKQMAGVTMDHVPFRGGPPATTALLAGQIQVYFDNITGSLSLVKSGDLVALALTGSYHDPSVPGVPIMKEFLPEFEITSWCCVCGPAKLSPSIVAQLGKWTETALKDEGVVRRYAELGAKTWFTSPAEMAEYRDQEEARFGPIIKSMNLKRS